MIHHIYFVRNDIFLLVTGSLYIAGSFYIKIFNGGESNETFQLTTGTLADKLHGVLCEYGK